MAPAVRPCPRRAIVVVAAAALLTCGPWAAASDRASDAAHEHALALIAQGRPSAAYGRLMELATAGHAASARLALVMCEHGPEVWGRDWDCTPDEVAQWARVGGVAVPALEPRRYGTDGRPFLRGMADSRRARTESRPQR